MGGGSSSTTPVDMTPQAFKGLQTPFAQTISKLVGLGGSGDPLAGIPSFQGPRTAPLGANEQTMLDQLQAQATDTSEFDATRDLFSRTVAGDFLPGQQGANPFLQAAIENAQRPTFQALEETLSRTLPGRFTEAGQFVQPQGSSAFDRAAAIASRGAADAASGIATDMSFGAYESERGRQTEAAQGLAQVSQQEFEQTVSNLQAQALPRLIEEYGIERGMAEFNTRIQTLTQLMAMAGGAAAPVIASESQATQKPNLLGPLLGAMI